MQQRYEQKEKYQRIVRFILCTALSFTVGRLIGYPYTSTIAVTAILVLYTDRGVTGSLRYGRKRVQIQIIMGAIVFALILFFRHFTPVPDWVIGIFAVSIAVAIGLPLDARYGLAPISVTLGNAALIMATGILTKPNYFWERVLFCVIGYGIGVFVNFVLAPRPNRIMMAKAQLREDLEQITDYFLEKRWTASFPVSGIGFLDKQLSLIDEDMRWKHLSYLPWEQTMLHDLLKAEKKLYHFVKAYGKYRVDLSERFCEDIFADMIQLLELHQSYLGVVMGKKQKEMSALPLVPAAANSKAEILVLAEYIEYLEQLYAFEEMKAVPENALLAC